MEKLLYVDNQIKIAYTVMAMIVILLVVFIIMIAVIYNRKQLLYQKEKQLQ